MARSFGGAARGGKRFGAGGRGSPRPAPRTIGSVNLMAGGPHSPRIGPFPGIGQPLRDQRPQGPVGIAGPQPYNLANGTRGGRNSRLLTPGRR